MKKSSIIKSGIVSLALIGIFSNINGVAAATRNRSLDGGYSTTTIRVTATYDSSGASRWSLGTAMQIASSGKGGGSSKSGGLSTSYDGKTTYAASQKYNISATDYNYNTVTGKRTFTWQINGSSLVWLNCYVK